MRQYTQPFDYQKFSCNTTLKATLKVSEHLEGLAYTLATPFDVIDSTF